MNILIDIFLLKHYILFETGLIVIKSSYLLFLDIGIR